MKRPILFLDIDGVLRTPAWMRAHRATVEPFNPAAVAQLQRIVDETRCRLVLSSMWRLGRNARQTLRGVHDKLVSAGLRSTIRFAGRTPDLTPVDFEERLACKPRRGREVRAWLDAEDYAGRYVCLDDEDDGLTALGHPLVQTRLARGLLKTHADRCIAILTGAR